MSTKTGAPLPVAEGRRRRRRLGWVGGIIATGLVVGLAAIWAFGPTIGTALLGRPVFLVPPTPERYATTVFDIAGRQGIYAGSELFAVTRARAEEAVGHADSVADTYPHIDAVLAAAGGKHSTLVLPGVVPKERQADLIPTVESGGQVVTVILPATDASWDGQAYVDAVAPALVESLRGDGCAVILDLRGNTGGDMGPMLAAVSPLLPDSDVLWFSTPLYDTPVTITGNSVRGGGTPMGAQVDEKFQVPVAVLTDSMTGSSGEVIMLAFRGLENSRSFGGPTAGYASANTTIEMPDGARILLTTAHNKARTGEIFGENPVEPDMVTVSAERAAREWIGQQGCGDAD